MRTLKIQVFTGRSSFDDLIANRLQKVLEEYTLEVTEDPTLADIAISTPDYCSLFPDMPILVLTDSADLFLEVDNAVEWTPVPITDDDFLRLEFRLLGIVHTYRLDDDG